MIEEVPERRFTLDKLRFKIKMEEEDIMKQEMADYKKTKSQRR
jgi:translation initiation factor IF-1